MSFTYRFTTRKDSNAIHIQLITRRVKTKFSTGVKGNTRHFHPDFGRFTKKEAGYKEKNDRLQQLEDKLEELRMRFVKYPDPTLTNARVKQLLQTAQAGAPTIIEVARQYFDLSGLRPSTRNMYDLYMQDLHQFAPGATIADLTPDFLEAYKQHLQKRGNKANTLRLKLYRLKSIMKYAMQEGMARFDLDPFRYVKIPGISIPYRHAITSEEVDLLATYPFMREQQRAAIDVFRLQYRVAGLRVSDALQMQPQHIQNGHFVFVQQKTKAPMMLPITEEAQALINAWKGKGQYLIPLLDYYTAGDLAHRRHIATAYINDTLKRACKKLGIKKHVTTHIARHSFGKQADDAKMPMAGIADALGQKSVRSTETYVRRGAAISKEALEAVYKNKAGK